MKYYIVLLWVVVMIAGASCSGSGNANREDSQEATATGFVMPPFVALCKNITEADSAALHDKRVMKRAVREIVKMLPATDSVTARRGLTVLFEGLRHDEKALASATEYADSFLNGLGSPVKNEKLYMDFLSTLLDVGSLPGVLRDVATERMRVVALNRPGTLASDFRFETRDGSRQSLYGIEAPMTLVVFYNPECSPCSAILKQLAAYRGVNKAISEGRLAVVAVYAEGKRDVWRNNLGEMPGNWIVGYDLSDILDNDLYDLPAMPTLYLLDADKRVVLKDPDHRKVGKIFAR